ncbi:hypothetical protein XPN_4118, partial [Xanthomonas arboricola pv. pruni MAFF 301427]
ERGGGSGTCRRTRPRLCGGGVGSPHPGPALHRCGEGDQEFDRRFGRAGRRRLDAGAYGRLHDGRNRGQRAARDRHHGRDFCGIAGTVGRYRTGQHHRDTDGRNHAAKRSAGGRSHRRRTLDGRTGRAADAGSIGVQDQRGQHAHHAAGSAGCDKAQRDCGPTCRCQKPATPGTCSETGGGRRRIARCKRLAGVL